MILAVESFTLDLLSKVTSHLGDRLVGSLLLARLLPARGNVSTL